MNKTPNRKKRNPANQLSSNNFLEGQDRQTKWPFNSSSNLGFRAGQLEDVRDDVVEERHLTVHG